MRERRRTSRPVDRLHDVRVDAESGLHIGTIVIGSQLLRVGIRPQRRGRGSAAVPLLLFNGIGANLELASSLMAELDAIETLIFDVPGAGQSPPPLLPYRLCSMASLARRLLDTLGYGSVDVMGVSWGGGLAQQFAIQYPARVRRLVLAATAIGAPLMLPARPRVLLKMLNPRRYLDAGYMQRVAPELYGGDARSHAGAIDAFTRHAHGGHPRGYRYQILAILGWTSLPWVWRISQPTLVMAGRDDPLVPLLNARLLAWLLRDSRLQVIDDGHLFLVTRARETAHAIAAFLAERGETSKRQPAATRPQRSSAASGVDDMAA